MADNQRLDHYLVRKYPDLSRGFIQKLIADDQVLVNSQVQKSSYKLQSQDKVDILYDLSSIGKVPSIGLPIIYEDENVLVVDKPTGVLSHALTKFHNEPSVASFLRERLNKPDNDVRFGIVHRLDRLTSGVMICAKNHKTMQHLQKQFADRKVEKTYTAIVSGVPKLEAALLDWPIERNPKMPARFRVGANGKPSQTQYKLIKHNETYSQLELKPLTGRTHQLRVHLAYLGNPIIGDQLYSGPDADRLYLHAHTIKIKLPDGTSKVFTVKLPKEFRELIK